METTGGLSVPDYIQQQMEKHNFEASTVLETNVLDIDAPDRVQYQGMTLFEIYLNVACASQRYLFGEGDRTEFLQTMHHLLVRGGAEMAPLMVDKVLDALEHHTYGEFEYDINDFHVRGAIIDVLAKVCPEHIKESADWASVHGLYWENIPGTDDPDKRHYMMYLKNCSEFLSQIVCHQPDILGQTANQLGLYVDDDGYPISLDGLPGKIITCNLTAPNEKVNLRGCFVQGLMSCGKVATLQTDRGTFSFTRGTPP